jgi:hypothetical protein
MWRVFNDRLVFYNVDTINVSRNDSNSELSDLDIFINKNIIAIEKHFHQQYDINYVFIIYTFFIKNIKNIVNNRD